MRRKVIQHFANMLPQRFLDLPDGFDLAILAHDKSGLLVLNILEGTATLNDVSCPEIRTAASYREWLFREAKAHGVPMEGLSYASMNVDFEVAGTEVKESFGNVFRSATFSLECFSELRTDERSYFCRLSGSKAWGYGYYWEQLFGSSGRVA